ncbi:MAG: hypothetical protein FWB85_05595 [Chitinispirillia bacterium]|nr:hypothetical protein [Chitinispirillia bacterium]MCL2241702.1 hypothetical protein [Chitinispirillia bacterium]
MIKYRMNLVRSLRVAEKRDQTHKAWATLMLLGAFVVLAGAGYFVYDRVAGMQRVLNTERTELSRLDAEYQELLKHYESTQSTVDRADIELLNQIQTGRIYWTKKLEAMARHLPENEPISYWITRFNYRGAAYGVSGYGYITERQEQLLALDDYLNKLRADPNWSDVFGTTSLRSAVRSDEIEKGVLRERVSFEYASMKKGGAQ